MTQLNPAGGALRTEHNPAAPNTDGARERRPAVLFSPSGQGRKLERQARQFDARRTWNRFASNTLRRLREKDVDLSAAELEAIHQLAKSTLQSPLVNKMASLKVFCCGPPGGDGTCPKQNFREAGAGWDNLHLDHQPSLQSLVEWISAERRMLLGERAHQLWFAQNQAYIAHCLFGSVPQPASGFREAGVCFRCGPSIRLSIAAADSSYTLAMEQQKYPCHPMGTEQVALDRARMLREREERRLAGD